MTLFHLIGYDWVLETLAEQQSCETAHSAIGSSSLRIAPNSKVLMSEKVIVYRFTKESEGKVLAPRYMAGTLKAIEDLGAVPIRDSAREVDAKLLEHGFYYEHTPSEPLANSELPKTEAGHLN